MTNQIQNELTEIYKKSEYGRWIAGLQNLEGKASLGIAIVMIPAAKGQPFPYTYQVLPYGINYPFEVRGLLKELEDMHSLPMIPLEEEE